MSDDGRHPDAAETLAIIGEMSVIAEMLDSLTRTLIRHFFRPHDAMISAAIDRAEFEFTFEKRINLLKRIARRQLDDAQYETLRDTMNRVNRARRTRNKRIHRLWLLGGKVIRVKTAAHKSGPAEGVAIEELRADLAELREAQHELIHFVLRHIHNDWLFMALARAFEDKEP